MSEQMDMDKKHHNTYCILHILPMHRNKLENIFKHKH